MVGKPPKEVICERHLVDRQENKRSEDGDGDKEKGKHENEDEDVCTTRIYNGCYTFITRIRNGSWSIIRRTRRVI